MGRNKIDKYKKNIIKSVSLIPQQVFFIDTHPSFDLSKFVQIKLQQHMDEFEFIKEKDKEVKE